MGVSAAAVRFLLLVVPLSGGCAGRAAHDGAAASAQEKADCPTIEPGSNAFLVHGARVKDGAALLDPADVLVANGTIVLVGPAVCYHAERGAQVAFVDGAGAVVMARDGGRVAVGGKADGLDLVTGAMTRPVVRPGK